MSDDLPEDAYHVIETAIDLLDYVEPANAHIYIGSYVAAYHDEKNQRKPGVSREIEGKSYTFKYKIVYDKKALPQIDLQPVGDSADVKSVSHIDRSWAASGDVGDFSIYSHGRLADLIYDDVYEMQACDLPWARVVAGLTESMRRDLFERPLHEQKEMPQGLAVDGQTFLRQIAESCTYDSDGNYYNKWKGGGKRGPKGLVSEKYEEWLRKHLLETFLERNQPYMIVASDQHMMTYRLITDGTKTTRIIPHRQDMGRAWQLGPQSADVTRNFNIYIVATKEGVEKESLNKARAL